MIQFVVFLWAPTNTCHWDGLIFTELHEESLSMYYIYIQGLQFDIGIYIIKEK